MGWYLGHKGLLAPPPPSQCAHVACFCTFFKIFHVRLGKKRKLLVFTAVYVCVKAKLTLISFFFFFFFCTFHLSQSAGTKSTSMGLLKQQIFSPSACGLSIIRQKKSLHRRTSTRKLMSRDFTRSKTRLKLLL